MDEIRDIMNKIISILAGATLAAMVLLTFWQVLTRYLLKNPSTWSEELVSYLFAWSSLLGASVITGEAGHMNIPILVDRSVKYKKMLLILAEAIAFIFSAVILLYGGVKITSLAMGQMTSALGVSVGIFYIIMPVCGLLNMVYTVLNMIVIAKGGEL